MLKLHLTKDEMALFQALPKPIQNGWEVEEEVLSFEDTPSRRSMRMSMVKLHDPRLLSLREKFMAVQDKSAELVQLLQIDLSDVNYDDMLQLFYAAGPGVLSLMISQFLHPNSTDADLQMVASLSSLRHTMLFSFVEAYSSPVYL